MTDFANETLDELCPTFEPGPLDVYRRQATFCWRRFKLKFFSEEALALKMKVWKVNDVLSFYVILMMLLIIPMF